MKWFSNYLHGRGYFAGKVSSTTSTKQLIIKGYAKQKRFPVFRTGCRYVRADSGSDKSFLRLQTRLFNSVNAHCGNGDGFTIITVMRDDPSC